MKTGAITCILCWRAWMNLYPNLQIQWSILMKFGVDNFHVMLYGRVSWKSIDKRRISSRRIHEILPYFIIFLITFGIEDDRKYVERVCEFRKYWRSKCHTSLTGCKWLSVLLSTLNYSLWWYTLYNKRSESNTIENLWASWKLVKLRPYSPDGRKWL